jgi:imidazolonepropionase-like amidohydrolase
VKLLTLVLVLAAVPWPVAGGPSADLAVRHVTIIDVRNGQTQTNQRIIVQNGRIVAIGPEGPKAPQRENLTFVGYVPLGKTDDLGTVEKGTLADLVILDANPLDDVHNTTKINAVIAQGKLLERADLDRLLH